MINEAAGGNARTPGHHTRLHVHAPQVI
jgi:hypothetical protein